MTARAKNKRLAYFQQAKQDPAFRAERLEALRYHRQVTLACLIGAGVFCLTMSLYRSWEAQSVQIQWTMLASCMLMVWVHSNNAVTIAALEAMNDEEPSAPRSENVTVSVES